MCLYRHALYVIYTDLTLCDGVPLIMVCIHSSIKKTLMLTKRNRGPHLEMETLFSWIHLLLLPQFVCIFPF